MWKRPLLLLLLKIKGYFVFVLFPVGPSFDLETKKSFFAGFRTTLFLMAVTVFLNLVSFIPYWNNIFPSGIPI